MKDVDDMTILERVANGAQAYERPVVLKRNGVWLAMWTDLRDGRPRWRDYRTNNHAQALQKANQIAEGIASRRRVERGP